eukprot:COSAG05_NODE_6007_length_1041_cov_1.912951_2_plen_79_part_00
MCVHNREDGVARVTLVDKQKLSPEEKELKEELLAEGFGNWGRRDFLAFIRGCTEHGWCAPACASRSQLATCTAQSCEH